MTCSSLLEGGVQFPPHLVVMRGGAPAWTRPPENAKEQYLHFIFHLRLTMDYLARNPIGKVTQPSTSDVGKMLTQLPRRSAFVRSGEDVGVMYTMDAPRRLTGREQMERIRAVLAQTRSKYCYSRAQIERIFQPPATDAGTASRANSSAPIPDEVAADDEPTLVVDHRSRWEPVE